MATAESGEEKAVWGFTVESAWCVRCHRRGCASPLWMVATPGHKGSRSVPEERRKEGEKGKRLERKEIRIGKR